MATGHFNISTDISDLKSNFAENSNTHQTWSVWRRTSRNQIWFKYIYPFVRCGRVFLLTMATKPSWIFRNGVFQHMLTPEITLLMCLQNFDLTSVTVPEIWLFNENSRWRLPPCWISPEVVQVWCSMTSYIYVPRIVTSRSVQGFQRATRVELWPFLLHLQLLVQLLVVLP